jgi:hypothetical protein
MVTKVKNFFVRRRGRIFQLFLQYFLHFEIGTSTKRRESVHRKNGLVPYEARQSSSSSRDKQKRSVVSNIRNGGSLILSEVIFSSINYFPLESNEQFIQRGIVTIGHDMRDNNQISVNLLDHLRRIETKFDAFSKVREEAEDDFMDQLPLNSLEDFDRFNEDLSSKSLSRRLVSKKNSFRFQSCHFFVYSSFFSL